MGNGSNGMAYCEDASDTSVAWRPYEDATDKYALLPSQLQR